MKSYRIGQEITVRWAILSSGEPRPLAGRDLKLVLHSPRYADHQIDNFTIDGNVVEFNITPDMAKMTGVYSLTLWENYGKPRQTAVDSCRAFELVPTTCDIDNCHDLADGETLQLCSFLDTGIKGDPGEGVPAGGAPGQVLSKASNKDFDSEWIDPAGRRVKSSSGQDTAEIHNASQFQDLADTVPGHNSFSEGSGFASGDYSHAGGSQSEARGTSSFAHGTNTVAMNEGEVVFGMNPEVDDSGNSIFQLGAGAVADKRKTVFRVNKDGTIICVDPTTGEKMALQEVIKQLQQTLYDFFNNAEDADETINKWHEVKAFLDGIKDTDNLASILAGINETLSKTADLSQVVRTDEAQNLTAEAQQTARTNISAMTDTPSGDPMHDMYEQAGAVWNSETGYWELNTLNDLTTEEMRQIYAESHLSRTSANMEGYWRESKSRTNICNSVWSANSALVMFSKCSNLLVANLAWGNYPMNCSKLDSAFDRCSKLKTIINEISLYASTSTNNAFYGCAALETLYIRNIKSLSFADSPNLSIESGVYFINKSTETGIVVTLHDDAYERFIADPTIQAALAAHTNITLAAAGSPAVVTAAAPARMMSLRAAPLRATELEIADGQLIAPAGMFITQAADVADSERLYFTRKTWNVDDDISIWRVASVSEREEWQERMNAEDDAMVINN